MKFCLSQTLSEKISHLVVLESAISPELAIKGMLHGERSTARTPKREREDWPPISHIDCIEKVAFVKNGSMFFIRHGRHPT